MPAGAGEESVANIDKLRHMKGWFVFNHFLTLFLFIFHFRQHENIRLAFAITENNASSCGRIP